jgi:hypothetical protein
MARSNRGGARPGAGRPKLEIIKIPAKSGFRFQVVGIPEQMWEEFKEAAHNTLTAIEGVPQESDYVRLADLAMIEGIHRYINQNKTQTRKDSR